MNTLDETNQNLVMNAACHAISMSQESLRMVLSEYERPCVVFKPKLTLDGNQWCALFGDNLQEGVAGFGESPYKAMSAFDTAWFAKLPTAREQQ